LGVATVLRDKEVVGVFVRFRAPAGAFRVNWLYILTAQVIVLLLV
jgi:hypothetical protein